jgi:hypothetical protein
MATLGVAGAGLVLGHWLAYALAAPEHHARDRVLAETGHGYLPFVTQVALLGGAIALAGLFLTRMTSRIHRGSPARDAAALFAVQSGVFLAMEIGERLLSGASLHDLTHGPLLAIGLGVQAVVAIAGAILMRLTERAAEAAGTLARSGPTPARLIEAIPAVAVASPRRPEGRAPSSRAPPFPA